MRKTTKNNVRPIIPKKQKFYLFFGKIIIIFEKQEMRIFTEKTLKEYAELHPEVKSVLKVWIDIVKRSDWENFADIRATFNSADSVGNQRYVFNIKGNQYRIVMVVKFTIKYVYVRFIGTHTEYDKIDCSTI